MQQNYIDILNFYISLYIALTFICLLRLWCLTPKILLLTFENKTRVLDIKYY